MHCTQNVAGISHNNTQCSCGCLERAERSPRTCMRCSKCRRPLGGSGPLPDEECTEEHNDLPEMYKTQQGREEFTRNPHLAKMQAKVNDVQRGIHHGTQRNTRGVAPPHTVYCTSYTTAASTPQSAAKLVRSSTRTCTCTSQVASLRMHSTMSYGSYTTMFTCATVDKVRSSPSRGCNDGCSHKQSPYGHEPLSLAGIPCV